MNVLITGVTGFAGSHLADYINGLGQWHGSSPSVYDRASGHEVPHVSAFDVFGTKRRRSPLDNICSKVELTDCELTDYPSVHRVIDSVRPCKIFHLAAQSFVPQSWDSPEYTFQVNVFSTLNIMEAIRRIDPEIQLLVAGSSEEYGLVLPSECPITENQPLRPMSPYGVSKVAMDLLARQYVKSYGLKIVITRAFNHTGPRRGQVFATSNFANQIAWIEAGNGQKVIRVGNLDAQRDFTDVRDMVRAYWLALETCEYGEPYNIGTGTDVSMLEVLDTLLKLSGQNIKTEVDPSRLRPSDVPRLQSDSTKFRKLTGWVPFIPFNKTMKDLLEYWREKLK